MGIKHERIRWMKKRSVLWRSGQNLPVLQAENKFWAPQEAAKPRMSGVRVSFAQKSGKTVAFIFIDNVI